MLLFALYGVLSSYDAIPETMRQVVDQHLRELRQQQSTFTREQCLLLEAINHCFGHASSLFLPEVVSEQNDVSSDERVRDLDRLSQKQPLSTADVAELLSACHDTRGVSRNNLRGLIHGSYWWGESIGSFAWKLLDEAWSLTPVAWQATIDNLKDDDAYLCVAAALLLQRGKNVPPEERVKAIERIQALLANDSLLSLPLVTPLRSLLQLDDVLFNTLQALVKQG